MKHRIDIGYNDEWFAYIIAANIHFYKYFNNRRESLDSFI